MRRAIALALLTFGLASAAQAAPPSFSNPVDYCRATITVDKPGPTYKGPAVPDWMARIMGVQPNLVAWRCSKGAVLACVEWNGASCGTAPWLDRPLPQPNENVRQGCVAVPNAECEPGTHCIWACRAGRPVLNRNQYATDERGFMPEEWKVLAAPVAAPPAPHSSKMVPPPTFIPAYGTSTPAAPSTTPAADVAVSFYRWYLHNLDADVGFTRSERFRTQRTQWLTHELSAHWQQLLAKDEVDPVLQAQDYRPSWVTTIHATVASSSPASSTVVIALGRSNELHRITVHMVLTKEGWRIASLRRASGQ